MTRRFEFVAGSSAKFWEVTHAGTEVTISFGRIGTIGQRQSKSLPTPAAATRHVEKLIDQKLAKGYREPAAV
jgi:predicted DNA-binding WGR domain protein